jgi:hypothetical protein
MALATSLRKTASKLMLKFGGVATIRRVTTADSTVRGVLEDVRLSEVNDLIQAGDKRLLIAAADVSNAPTTADEVLISSVTHQIIEVRTIEQDNTPITYELILRA